MKKVLFATTALVATAGMAAADVSFGGYGRFGLYYQDNDLGQSKTRIEQRFRLTITGTTESDNGLKFEGRIRFQTDEQGPQAIDLDDDGIDDAIFDGGASNSAKSSAAGFAVTAGSFRMDVGSVSNVLDSGDVVNYFGYGVGLTSFLEQSNGFGNTAVGFGSTGSDFDTVAPTVKLRYSMGDFTVSASVTDDADTLAISNVGVPSIGGGERSYQLGASYAFGNYSVGGVIGSTRNGVSPGIDNDEWILGFSGDIGAFAFTAIVGDSDAQGALGNGTSYGFSVKYDIGAATDIRGVWMTNGADTDKDSYGIGFQHSLGGGVSLRGGIGKDKGTSKADVGVIFNF